MCERSDGCVSVTPADVGVDERPGADGAFGAPVKDGDARPDKDGDARPDIDGDARLECVVVVVVVVGTRAGAEAVRFDARFDGNVAPSGGPLLRNEAFSVDDGADGGAEVLPSVVVCGASGEEVPSVTRAAEAATIARAPRGSVNDAGDAGTAELLRSPFSDATTVSPPTAEEDRRRLSFRPTAPPPRSFASRRTPPELPPLPPPRASPLLTSTPSVRKEFEKKDGAPGLGDDEENDGVPGPDDELGPDPPPPLGPPFALPLPLALRRKPLLSEREDDAIAPAPPRRLRDPSGSSSGRGVALSDIARSAASRPRARLFAVSDDSPENVEGAVDEDAPDDVTATARLTAAVDVADGAAGATTRPRGTTAAAFVAAGTVEFEGTALRVTVGTDPPRVDGGALRTAWSVARAGARGAATDAAMRVAGDGARAVEPRARAALGGGAESHCAARSNTLPPPPPTTTSRGGDREGASSKSRENAASEKAPSSAALPLPPSSVGLPSDHEFPRKVDPSGREVSKRSSGERDASGEITYAEEGRGLTSFINASDPFASASAQRTERIAPSRCEAQVAGGRPSAEQLTT